MPAFGGIRPAGRVLSSPRAKIRRAASAVYATPPMVRGMGNTNAFL